MRQPLAPDELRKVVRSLKHVEEDLKASFVEREEVARLLVLAAVCQEHLLLLGPPGTAKTQVVTAFTAMVKAKGFSYLLTRFTEPSELFGPLDLEAFKRGTYQLSTKDMLPDAEVAFLDEVFQGSSAILNTLQTIVNERVFHDGAVRRDVPLLVLIGASNALPDDPALRAFADRFLLRASVAPVSDDALDRLVARGFALERERIERVRPAERLDAEALRRLHLNLLDVGTESVRPVYVRALQELRAEGVELSDRRAVKGLKLVAGAALLDGAGEATPAHLWPLLHVWSRPEEAARVAEVVGPRVEEAGGTPWRRARGLDEALSDLEAVEARGEGARGETALAAYLQELNRLRRELLRDHPGALDARRRVEAAIERALETMEGA